MFFVFVRDRVNTQILEVAQLPTAGKSPDDIAEEATAAVLDFQARWYEHRYEIVSGSAESLEAFLRTFPEYRPWNGGGL